MRFFFENNMATVAQVKEAGFFYCSTGDPLWNNVLPSSQRERRVSRLNRTGKNTTGWARRLTALLVTACLVMAMALPVYAEVDPLPGAPDEVELLEDEQGTASGEDTVPPEQNATNEDGVAVIARHMNYGLYRVEGRSDCPRDALNICRMLSLKPEILEKIEQSY